MRIIKHVSKVYPYVLAVNSKRAETQNAMVCDVCRAHVNIVIRSACGSQTRGPADRQVVLCGLWLHS